MKNYQILKNLKWHKLSLKLEKIRKSYFEKEILNVVVEAIVKQIKKDITENIFFHIKDHNFGAPVEKGDNIIVEIIAPDSRKSIINVLEKKAIEYLNSPEGGKNYRLINTYIEYRDLTTLFHEISIDLNSKEVTLEFLTPLHFKPFPDKHFSLSSKKD